MMTTIMPSTPNTLIFDEWIYIAGIDYSLTCPCLCLYSTLSLIGDVFSFDKCEFFFLSAKEKFQGNFDKNKYHGGYLPETFKNDETRHDFISKFILSKLPGSKLTVSVLIEGYSMGSKGRVFNIAENTGLLKHKLWSQSYPYEIVAPTVIKKFATGKGNADKNLMQEAFIKETGINLKDIFYQTVKSWNPSSDIIDAYYIAKYGHSQVQLKVSSNISQP